MAEASIEQMQVVITGANGGLGAELVTRFAMAGYDVVGTVRSEQRADELRAQLPDGVSVTTSLLDLSDVAAIGDWSKQFIGERGAPDVLVNNAGTTAGDGLFMSRKPDGLRSLMDVNFFGPFELTRLLVPKMARIGGSVLTISSVSGYIANPGQAPYGASKAAMDRAMMVAASEFQERGLAVVSLAPGAINTAMFMNLPEDARAHILGNTYSGVPIEPETVASAGLFLVLNRTTGKVVHMNDGLFEPPKGSTEHIALDDVDVNEQAALDVYEQEIVGKVH